MSIEIQLWHLVSLLLSFFGAAFTGAKILAGQFEKRLGERFDTQEKRLCNIGDTLKSEAAEWKRVERELMNLKADIPVQYVRREDYIRGQSVLEAKLDALYEKIGGIPGKGARHD
ncbi:MAG: hypothetical protein LBQ62_09985 [Candidatus Accumulibacter sp.]|jgi:hypothetical protein|nr:hypothetical protein [Accumulibacter sp.]